MATPPTIRQAMNAVKQWAHPVRTEERAKRSAGKSSRTLAAKAVAEHAGEERSGEAADQGATVGPSDERRRT